MRRLDMLVVFAWGFVAAWVLSRFGFVGWSVLFVVFLALGKQK